MGKENNFYRSEYWREWRRKILRRDGHRCTYRYFFFRCKEEGGHMHVHHILPRHRGGGESWENLVTLCPKHHAMKHSDIELSFKE